MNFRLNYKLNHEHRFGEVMKLGKLTVASLMLSSVSLATFASDAHWEYSGKHGPEHWGDLSAKYSTCSKGMNQSPIDISSTIESDLTPLKIMYQKSGGKLVNNGHTIKLGNIKPISQGNNSFGNDAGQFELAQLKHLHVVTMQGYALQFDYPHQ